MLLEVLVEGGADVPAVREVLKRRFGLVEDQDFRIHPHKGKGKLPVNPKKRPDPKQRGLLDQLPAKLRGYAHVPDCAVVVLVDADDEGCLTLKASLTAMLTALDRRPPHVLLRIAVEETESWLIAEPEAVRRAYPQARLGKLRKLKADAVCDAWERLAEALGLRPADCDGQDKYAWAETILPQFDLDAPRSPSLQAFITGIERLRTVMDAATGQPAR